jgi:hypothetical protein
LEGVLVADLPAEALGVRGRVGVGKVDVWVAMSDRERVPPKDVERESDGEGDTELVRNEEDTEVVGLLITVVD